MSDMMPEDKPLMQTNENANTGGRQRFCKNEEVRILELDGQVSNLTYLIDPECDKEVVRADRKGHVNLGEKDTSRKIKVHFRRILPIDVDNKAPVIEAGDKFIALCPKCGDAIGVTPSSKSVDCQKCGTYKLHWLGVKPMADTAVEKKSMSKKLKNDRPKVEKLAKNEAEPIIPDLDAYSRLPNCELWVKSGVKFDHPSIDVKSYTILFIGNSPRKFCFNTYNGTLGKKGELLPVKNFLENEPLKGTRNPSPWYMVRDVDKTKAKLEKDGYERV